MIGTNLVVKTRLSFPLLKNKIRREPISPAIKITVAALVKGNLSKGRIRNQRTERGSYNIN